MVHFLSSGWFVGTDFKINCFLLLLCCICFSVLSHIMFVCLTELHFSYTCWELFENCGKNSLNVFQKYWNVFSNIVQASPTVSVNVRFISSSEALGNTYRTLLTDLCLDTAIMTQLQEQVSFYKQNQLYVKQSVSSGVQGVTLNIAFGELAHTHACRKSLNLASRSPSNCRPKQYKGLNTLHLLTHEHGHTM